MILVKHMFAFIEFWLQFSKLSRFFVGSDLRIFLSQISAKLREKQHNRSFPDLRHQSDPAIALSPSVDLWTDPWLIEK